MDIVKGQRVLALSLLLVTTSCNRTGGHGKEIEPEWVEASAKFEPAPGVTGFAIASLEAEYANFSEECTKHTPLIGPVGYPRVLEVVGRDRASVGTVLRGKARCTVFLVSVQSVVTDGQGEGRAARGSASYRASLERGSETSSCYVSSMGPGYCLEDNEATLTSRKSNRSNFIGVMTVTWERRQKDL